MPHSEAEADQILEPYKRLFGQIFPVAWEGWERFGESNPDLRLMVNATTRANMLNNFGASAAQEIFADLGPEIVLTDRPGFLLIIVESKLHVRLKKYRGRTCQTSGIPTKQQQEFELQQPTISGFPEASNCVLGYNLKSDASYFAETSISCKTKKRLHWKIDVPMIEAGANVEEFPTQHRDESKSAEPGISSTMIDEQAEEGGIGG